MRIIEGDQGKLIEVGEILRRIEVEGNGLRVSKHPNEPLISICYDHESSCKGPDSDIWDEVMLSSRGIIIDTKRGEIVSHPWNKFFNYEIDERIGRELSERDEVLEKVDGSIGITYFGEYDIIPSMASKNSFTSSQAEFGTRWIREKVRDEGFIFNRTNTYIFEIIYPENRIVVDYGEKRGCILIGIIETRSHKELEYRYLEEYRDKYGIEIAKRYEFKDIGEIIERSRGLSYNEEGYVVTLRENGSSYKYKIKSDEYRRAHKLIYSFNDDELLRLIREEKDIEEYLSGFPIHIKREYLNKRKYIEKELEKRRTELEDKYNEIYREDMSRKEYSGIVMDRYKRDSSNLFNRYDGKEVNIRENIIKEIGKEMKEPY